MDKAWTSRKAHFKDIYEKKERHKKATEKKGFESAANMRDRKVTSEESIRDMFEELSDT